MHSTDEAAGGHIQFSTEQSRIIILLVPTVHSTCEAAGDHIQLSTEQYYISKQWLQGSDLRVR